MKNFRVRRIHIVCLAIATAEILIAAFVLWKNAIWNETKIQTASKQSVLLETQEETTSGIQENEKTATQNQEETKPAEEAVSSMPSMRVKLKNSDDLKTATKYVALKINAGGEVSEGLATYSRAIIAVTDRLVKPEWWDYKDLYDGEYSSVDWYYLGDYSDTK